MEAMIEKMRHDDSAHVAYGLRLRAENATLAELLEEFHRNAVMAADLMAAALTPTMAGCRRWRQRRTRRGAPRRKKYKRTTRNIATGSPSPSLYASHLQKRTVKTTAMCFSPHVSAKTLRVPADHGKPRQRSLWSGTSHPQRVSSFVPKLPSVADQFA